MFYLLHLSQIDPFKCSTFGLSIKQTGPLNVPQRSTKTGTDKTGEMKPT